MSLKNILNATMLHLILSLYICVCFERMIVRWIVLLTGFLFLQREIATAQTDSCNYAITGKVFDQHDKEPLLYAEIFIKELSKGVISDSLGNYEIKKVCAGNYTLVCQHVGCDPVVKNIAVNKNLKVNFILEHHAEELMDIEVNAKRIEEEVSQQKVELTEIKYDRQSGKTLGDALKEISGVTTLNTGNTIAKPVIHGMYGNRVLTMNNGVRQEDQQWGNEHAPNIDPFANDKISVVKGAAAVQYGSDAIGGVVLLEQEEPVAKTEGGVYLTGNTNGRGGSVAAYVKGFMDSQSKWIYKLQGTYRRAGDLHAPDYNLSNTGISENSVNALLQYKTWKRGIKAHYTYFNTNTGILRASRVGNITDLENAIQSSEPYYVEDFTYKIESPRQKVIHQIFRAEYFERFKNGSKLTFQYASQHNGRQEYDIRRGGRSDVPALDLSLQTYSGDVIFQHTKDAWHHKAGVNAWYQNNYNIPGTGIRPILPDYDAYAAGLFLVERYKKNRWELEGGARYDFKYIDAERFTRSNVLENNQFKFHNAAVSLGAIYTAKENLHYKTNLGTAFRPPNVYELLSDGVHQSASAIEEGNINLKSEQSIKWIHTLNTTLLDKKMQIEVSAYFNYVKNYIYLKPEDELRLTIRGAFPVFSYTQTDVGIAGSDFDFNYDIVKYVSFTQRTSFLYGRDFTAKNDLIYMPPVQFNNTLTLQTGKLNKIENIYLSLNHVGVLSQYWYPEGVDFTPPPAGYNLFNIYTGINIPFKQQSITFIFQIENAFDTAYRDYLNRFRYYADNMGRNFSLKIKYQFSHNPKHQKQ